MGMKKRKQYGTGGRRLKGSAEERETERKGVRECQMVKWEG